MALIRISHKPARAKGQDPVVTVETFVTHRSQADLAADLDDEGLYGEALVIRSEARAQRKNGKQAWWQTDYRMPPGRLPDDIWALWSRMFAQNRTTMLACVY
jgi:hypothetical protein